MKIVFIQPKYPNCWESLAIAYIGSYLRKHYDDELELSFLQGYFDSTEDMVKECGRADIVAFTCTSPVFSAATEIAKEIRKKNPSCRFIYGGYHPSALPAHCLQNEYVDQVVVGEGEEAMLTIAQGNQSPIIHGTKFSDYDDIFPDRELIKNQRTIDLCESMTGLRTTSFQSVRGCPFQCFFCAEHIITGKFNSTCNPLRERNAEHLVEEIVQVARTYRLDYFKFTDATWNSSMEKVANFCDELQRQHVQLPWEANIHAALANRDMFLMMKAAGCRQVNIGCESGSQRILNDIRKGLTVDRIKNTFKWAREAGLERRSFFIIGMPNETEEDISLTEKLAMEISPDFFGVTILCPYPGTDGYNHEQMSEYDWSIADEYSNPYWSTRYFSNEQLKAQQRHLVDLFSHKLVYRLQQQPDRENSNAHS